MKNVRDVTSSFLIMGGIFKLALSQNYIKLENNLDRSRPKHAQLQYEPKFSGFH